MDLIKENSHSNYLKKQKLINDGEIYNDWYLLRNHKQYGPFSTDSLIRFYKSHWIEKHHCIWRPGFESWNKVEDVDIFDSYKQKKIKKNITDKDFKKLLAKKDIPEDLAFVESNKAESQRSPFKVYMAMASCVLAGVIVASSVYYSLQDQNQVLNLVNDRQAERFKKVASTSLDSSGLSFASELINLDSGDPLLVFATNAKAGERLSYKLEGISGTVVGKYRYSKSFEMAVPDENIFTSYPLRESNGEFLPDGVYNLTVNCMTCNSEQALVTKEIELFSEGRDNYLTRLAQYKSQIKNNVSLEVQELKSISNELQSQYKELSEFYIQNKGNLSKWNQFSAQWLNKQDQIIDLLLPLNKESFRDRIYYISLYDSSKALAEKIFKMHNLINEDIRSQMIASADISKVSKNIGTSLKVLNANIDIAEAKLQNFNK